MDTLTQECEDMIHLDKIEDESENETFKKDITPGTVNKISEMLLPSEADEILGFLCRLSCESNNPRKLPNVLTETNSIKVDSTNGKVLILSVNDKLFVAYKQLNAGNYTGAPVIDTNNEYIGFIDLLDITWYIIKGFRDWSKDEEKLTLNNVSAKEPQTTSSSNNNNSEPDFKRYITIPTFMNATVLDVLYRPNWENKPYSNPVYSGFSTFYALEYMARTACHRLALLNNNQKICNILTQSMIISLIDQNLYRFNTIRDYPISKMIPLLSANLITCYNTDLTIDAFNKMVNNNIRGLGVINNNGVLIDSISVKDLKGIGKNIECYYKLWFNITDFKKSLNHHHNNNNNTIINKDKSNSPITVTPYDTFSTLIKKMDDGNIHRVYIVEYNNNTEPIPKYIITQRDVLRFLLYVLGLMPTTIEQANS